MENNKKFVTIVVGCCVLLVVIVAFVLAYSGRDVTTLDQRQIHLSVNGQQMVIDLKKDRQVLDLPCIMTKESNVFELQNDPSATVTIENKKLVTGREKKIDILKLSENYRLTMTVETAKDQRTIFLRSYSSLLPKEDLSSQVKNEDETPVVLKDEPVMYLLDGKGRIIWYQANTKEATNGSLYSNFQKHIIDEKPYYTYHLSDPEVNTRNLADYVPGQEILLDAKMQPVDNSGSFLTLMDAASLEKDTVIGMPSDNKGFILLGKKQFICEGLDILHPDNIPETLSASPKCQVAAPVVQEVKNGEIEWEWRSTDHPELYAASTSNNVYSSENVQEYLVLDQMILSDDAKTVELSFKNADVYVRINRETGEAAVEQVK